MYIYMHVYSGDIGELWLRVCVCVCVWCSHRIAYKIATSKDIHRIYETQALPHSKYFRTWETVYV